MLSSVQVSSQPLPTPAVDAALGRRQAAGTTSDSTDSFERSAFSAMFEQLGLASTSRLDASRDRVDFNFSFTSSSKESLSATGYVSRLDQHASLTLNYTYQRAVVVDGRRELKMFEASLMFEADTSQSLAVKPFKDKEDIMHFLNRLMNDVMDLMKDDSQVLTGISVNQEDLAALMSLDKGKVKRLFDGLISAIMTMAMLKRMTRGNDAGPNVILNERRQSSQGVTEEKESSAQFSFSININEVSASQSVAAAGKDVPAAAQTTSTAAAAATPLDTAA
jgi:hypothetical protein